MVVDNENRDLLNLFNNRVIEALGDIYSMFYSELHYYAINLYKGTSIDSTDAVQDTFLNLWQTSARFDDIINIKAYLFIAIKNNFKQYIKKNRLHDRFKDYSFHEQELFQVDVIESEVISNMHHILKLLPAESADILQLFFEGWEIDDISKKLGKTKRTIYNKKSEAIGLLRNKLAADKLLLIITFLKV